MVDVQISHTYVDTVFRTKDVSPQNISCIFIYQHLLHLQAFGFCVSGNVGHDITAQENFINNILKELMKWSLSF